MSQLLEVDCVYNMLPRVFLGAHLVTVLVNSSLIYLHGRNAEFIND